MGILASHTSLSSSLAPHPALPSVVASAGADGVVNVWDLDRGDCFCTHTNVLLYGPAEPTSDRGKCCGYLDVQFSPDGLTLVLTDENGRITIFDTQVPPALQTGAEATVKECPLTGWSASTPQWMREQYFASDYYELLYDSNGHCVERGSRQPPHIAPAGARCTHEGVSYPETIRVTLFGIQGPLPLPENVARWFRDDIRARHAPIMSEGNVINEHRKSRRSVRNPELSLESPSTAIITMGGALVQHERNDPVAAGRRGAARRTGNRTPQLSNRYRWSNAHELPESDIENEDGNDEDYEGNGRRIDESSADEMFDSPIHQRQHRGQPSSRRRNQSGHRRGSDHFAGGGQSQEPRPLSRASSRQTARRTYHELNSDDEELYEMMSTVCVALFACLSQGSQ